MRYIKKKGIIKKKLKLKKSSAILKQNSQKIFTFSRKSTEKYVLKTHFNKFLNFQMHNEKKIDLILFFINY